jgi:phospholipid transport system substrate-binding protein
MKRLWTLLLFFVPALALAQANTPDALVRSTTDDVVSIVKQDADLKKGRSSKIDALVEARVLPHFDFAQMTKLAVARNWNKATPEQQNQLVAQFKTLLVHTYAASISSVADYKIDVQPLRMSSDDNDVLVSTVVTRPGSAPITIDYRMEKSGAKWLVYDVLVDNVSLVTNYRSNFNSEVRRSGIDGLIQALQKRNKELGS